MLIEHNNLDGLLYSWQYFANDDGLSVKKWTDKKLADDHAVARFAKAFTSHSWGQSIEDLVAKRSDRAQVNGLDKIMDLVRFRERLDALAVSLPSGSDDRDAICRFLKAWDTKNRYGD